MKVQATSFALAKSISAACSEIPIGTNLRPSKVIPSFPGATKTCSTCGDSNNFLAIACSRPPEPTTKSFIAKIPQYKAITWTNAQKPAIFAKTEYFYELYKTIITYSFGKCGLYANFCTSSNENSYTIRSKNKSPCS